MAKARRDGRPSLVEKGQIGLHQVEDVGGVGALWTRALDVGLPAKFVRHRPPHSIGDKAALDPEDDVPVGRHSARWTDIASHPLGGGGPGLEKTRERSAALPRIEVNRPGGDAYKEVRWLLGGRRCCLVNPCPVCILQLASNRRAVTCCGPVRTSGGGSSTHVCVSIKL
jgi:hypothetical protein